MPQKAECMQLVPILAVLLTMLLLVVEVMVVKVPVQVQVPCITDFLTI